MLSEIIRNEHVHWDGCHLHAAFERPLIPGLEQLISHVIECEPRGLNRLGLTNWRPGSPLAE